MRIAPSAFMLAAGLLAIAPLSHAGISDGRIEWQFVRYGPLGGPTPIPVDFAYTLDLYFVAGDQGAAVNGVNMGYAADPLFDPNFLLTNGTVYNHAFGGDTPPNPALIPAFPALEFDTYLALGDRPVTTVTNSVDLTGNNNGELRATWFTIPPIELDPFERLRLLRVTVSDDATFLGGNGSQLEIGFVGFERTYAIPRSIVPTPASIATLGFASLVAARRRRR